MQVIVTGSAGKVGARACEALEAAGHQVARLDLRPDPGRRGSRVDFTDFGEVMGALSGIDLLGGRPDAVVHLAGIAAPGAAPDHVVFGTNTMSTYNVFSACARLGIQRVVWASSETLHGLPFTDPPAYLPIDEDHPVLPNWSYALSKQMGEVMADNFVRWTPGLSIASLRIANVYAGADYARLAAMRAHPGWGKGNLWSYVDATDAGEACRLATEAGFEGHERMIIAGPDTLSERPSADLAAEHCPGISAALDGHQSMLSSARAQRVIGYVPRFGWRQRVAEMTGRP